MALVDCKACDAEISRKAKRCPQCGEPVKKKSILLPLLFILFVLGLVGKFTDHNQPQSASSNNDSFSSIYEAQRKVKSLMKEPDSAEFRDVTPVWTGAVCGEVNARNGFGGFTGFQKFIYMGGLASLQESDRKFAKNWNTLCASEKPKAKRHT